MFSHQNVNPNPTEQCGPYEPMSTNEIDDGSANYLQHKFGSGNHDTIGMIVIDEMGMVSAGTSTNGARHKIPGYFQICLNEN